MSDVNKIDKAREYIESLANGLNPLTGEELFETVFDEPEIIRCLFFVRDILQSYKAAPVKTKSDTFEIDKESDLSKYILDRPSSLTTFIKNIKYSNKGLGPSANKIWDWLVEKGYLYVSTDNEGKNTKMPTDDGKKCGISYVEREGTNGKPYCAVVYDRNGQKLLLECIRELYSK